MFINVGYSNYVPKDKILAITGCNSKPLRTQRQKACENNALIDCTFGRKTLALVYLAGGPIVASAIAAETLKERVEKGA